MYKVTLSRVIIFTLNFLYLFLLYNYIYIIIYAIIIMLHSLKFDRLNVFIFKAQHAQKL